MGCTIRVIIDSGRSGPSPERDFAWTRAFLTGLPNADGYEIVIRPLRYRARPHLAAYTEFEAKTITIQVPEPFLKEAMKYSVLPLDDRVNSVMSAGTIGLAVMVQELKNVLGRELRSVLAAPILEGRADRLGIFEAGNVVAGVAAVSCDRPPADVFHLPLRPLCVINLFVLRLGDEAEGVGFLLSVDRNGKAKAGHQSEQCDSFHGQTSSKGKPV